MAVDRDARRNWIVHAALWLTGLLFVLPLVWMVFTSLKHPEDLNEFTRMEHGVQFWNYADALAAMRHFWGNTFNTVFLCTLNVVGVTLSSALAAYGLAHVRWRGRTALFVLTLATMMIPFVILLVPTYQLYRNLGWIGTFRPLWVSAFFGGAFYIFLLRQFFLTIPRDLLDAARIDGANELEIFFTLVLPLSRPALMVVGLFQFINVWKDFMGPLIYLQRPEQFTLSLALQTFQSQHGGTDWHHLMAAATVISAPLIILFFVTQKTFIEGIRMTGIKG